MGRTKGSRPKKMETAGYWEALLNKRGFSMERGRSKRVSYVGGVQALDFIMGTSIMGTRDKDGDLDISYAPKSITEEVAEEE